METVALILDIAWISSLILMNVTHVLRHGILWRYGCSTGLNGLLIPLIDHRMLDELAEAQDSERLRDIFKWINVLYWAPFVVGVVLFTISLSVWPLSRR